MIKLVVFDMGGVMIRDFHMADGLMPFLGYEPGTSFSSIGEELTEMLKAHGRGEISENDFWVRYEEITGRHVEEWRHESLFGRFFHPYLDDDTVQVVKDLKARGWRVVCGTDVIDAHYKYHMDNHQYDVFDKVYASHLIHIKKPSTEFFRYIADAEGVETDEMFFTDDYPPNIESAASLGVKVHLYENAGKLRKALEDLGLL